MKTSQEALQDYLNQRYEEDRKREKEHPDTICFSLTTDIRHWAEYRIFSVEDLHEYLDKEFQKEVLKGNILN